MAEVPTELIAQLRSGEWWTSSRVRTFAIILLVLEIAIFSFLVAGTHGWIVPLDKPNTTDFVSFYAGGTLANAGAPALAYDQAAHLAAEEALVGQGIQYQFFNYPPVYQALFMPFARLPYLMSFVLFEVATLLLYLGVARRVLDDYGPTALLALIAFPAVWWNIGLGQNAFLTAALFGAATLFVDRRPVLAGICFGALCYKPHFALLVPLALAVGGHWRAFFAAAGSAGALMLGSLALLGWETWHGFLLTAGASHSVYDPAASFWRDGQPVRRGAADRRQRRARLRGAGGIHGRRGRRGDGGLAARRLAAGAQRGAGLGDPGRDPAGAALRFDAGNDRRMLAAARRPEDRDAGLGEDGVGDPLRRAPGFPRPCRAILAAGDHDGGAWPVWAGDAPRLARARRGQAFAGAAGRDADQVKIDDIA